MPHSEEFMRRAEEAKRRVKLVSPEQANALVREGAIMLDVREAEEFGRGHIEGATQLSNNVLAQRVSEVIPDKGATIICYCSSGNRGAVAADTLQQLGYENAVSLDGGLKSYLNALPTS
jgi:rhodanese-related sulfurtransferase